MAIMATEQPQVLLADQKPAESALPEDMMVDEPAAQIVNGHRKSDEDGTEPDVPPVVNGKIELSKSASAGTDESPNQKAFAANSSVLEQAPVKSSTQPPPATAADAEMPDLNGTSPANHEPSLTTDADDVGAAGASIPTQAILPEEASTNPDPAPNSPAPALVADTMDMDAPIERTSLTNDEKPTGDIHDTAGFSDAPRAASPQQPDQSSVAQSGSDGQGQQSDAVAPAPDTPKADQVASVTKIPRGREEDSGEERAAKRAKTEDSSGPAAESLVVASVLSPSQADHQVADHTPEDQPITPFQNKQIRQHLASLKKTKNGSNFRQSVERLWPGLWTDYKSKIENPVDISLFESKLREDKYANYGEFKADVQLLYENSVVFNGPSNVITVAAGMVRDQLFACLPEISKLEEPAKPEKGKVQPTRHAEPRAATQPRRQSQSQRPAVVASPKQKSGTPVQSSQPTPAPSSAPAFAIPPNGIPQIRRDSTREDSDRPKRPIHPPKSRDLDYASANRKKLEPEQRFFEVVLEEVKKQKHFSLNQWFLSPVDPVALNIPTYFSVVKKPMDLGTMTKKNYEGEYKSVKDMEKDMRLIVHNAELFNGPSHEVTVLAKELDALFKAELGKRDQWMKRHGPPEAPPPSATASAPSPERSNHESEEEAEGGGDEGGSSEAIRNLQGRLDEEQDKLNTLLGSKKPDLTMIEIQQQMVSMIQRKLVEEKTKFHSEAKKPKPKKKPAKSKPKAGGGGTAVMNNKKAATGSAAAPKKPLSNSTIHKKTSTKSRPVGQLEKAVIAEGINELDGNTLTKAVEIIKRDTGQNENDDGEMELDIDALSTEALRKLYDLIHKANPGIRSVLEKKPEFSSVAEPEPKSKLSGPPKAKKNKPMNKHEQERKIEQLRELKAQLQRHGSGSQEPLPGEVEEKRPAESSEEESDSEEE
ncbi:Bromodomain-containing protein [Durotheca rogersii]|uniref:Bromodomain-containing protein n=1 Tax=Durotheca rogersii TaxID=419775 RepID=UPI002220481F|nr:Bromodomain-containing protein [Durotheca rogersii]KAI5851762.1 Bromodomain-containing protein [Durotheca rogersii]